MVTLSTYSTMVVRVDPGSEMVVKREGERKGSAEGWMARST
jgi:hypothetical protein